MKIYICVNSHAQTQQHKTTYRSSHVTVNEIMNVGVREEVSLKCFNLFYFSRQTT